MARIFICDDDKSIGGMLTVFLSSLNHRVEHALDVQAFKTLLESAVPNLAIIDMQVDGGGGPAAVRLLPSSIPVIILSGMPTAQQMQWFAGRPGIRFLEKPVDLQTLENSLNALLPNAPR